MKRRVVAILERGLQWVDQKHRNSSEAEWGDVSVMVQSLGSSPYLVRG